jgi:hypothetical protein
MAWDLSGGILPFEALRVLVFPVSATCLGQGPPVCDRAKARGLHMPKLTPKIAKQVFDEGPERADALAGNATDVGFSNPKGQRRLNSFWAPGWSKCLLQAGVCVAR